MKFLLVFVVAEILAGQPSRPCTPGRDTYVDTLHRETYDCAAPNVWSPRKTRVFEHADATVSIVWGNEGVLPLLHTGPNIEADTAIIDIFYRYETSEFTGTDGKPAKLLLSVRVTCPVFAGIDSACDNAPQRMGFSLEAIEFVRVKYFRTVREIDVKPQ